MVYKNGYLSDSNMEFERVFLKKRKSKWWTRSWRATMAKLEFFAWPKESI